MHDASLPTYLEHHPQAIGVLFLFGLLSVELPFAAWATFIHGP